MKKFLAVMLVVVALFAMAGCSEKGTCEGCGKENVSVEEVKVMGKTAKMCENCADDLDELKDALNK